MRSVLLGLLLMATVFAGCASEPIETPDVAADEPVPSTLDLVNTHADYGFATYLDLEEGNMSDFPAPGEWSMENPPGTAAWKKPMHRGLPDVLSTIGFQTRTGNEHGAAGIAVFGPLAFAGGQGGDMDIINIMDPEAPQVIASSPGSPNRDVDTILYPDGRLVVVGVNGRNPMVFTDVTDPYTPVITAEIETPHSNHNVAVVPGTPIVYNSVSGGSFTDIVDASDPSNPVVVKEWENGYGCHDMTFYMNATEGKYRGYCAGLDKIQIWDLADPLEPTVLNEWGWPAAGVHDTGSVPLVTFAHLAMPNHDASILILGDETGGGAAPGCDFSAHEPVTGTTVTGPLGNLWFYDIRDEMAPVLKGSVSPSAYEQRGSCTAHFGKVVEDTNHVVMGFYSAGVTLVDFTDPQNPYVKDRYEQPLPTSEGEGAGTIWDVWYYQGYLFTGDTRHGIDVLTLD